MKAAKISWPASTTIIYNNPVPILLISTFLFLCLLTHLQFVLSFPFFFYLQLKHNSLYFFSFHFCIYIFRSRLFSSCHVSSHVYLVASFLYTQHTFTGSKVPLLFHFSPTYSPDHPSLKIYALFCFLYLYLIVCFLKFHLKVGVEESSANAPRITDHGSAI
jgi:hypothetical protein